MATIRKNIRAEVMDDEGIVYTVTDDTGGSGYITIETNGTEIAIPQAAVDAIIEALKYVSEPA